MTWVIGRHLHNNAVSMVSDIQVTYLDGSQPPRDCLTKQYRVTATSRVIVAFAGIVEECFTLLDHLAAYLNDLEERQSPDKIIESWYEDALFCFGGKLEMAELVIGGVETINGKTYSSLAKLKFSKKPVPENIVFIKPGEDCHIGSGAASSVCQELYEYYTKNETSGKERTEPEYTYRRAVDISKALRLNKDSPDGISTHFHVGYIDKDSEQKQNTDRRETDSSATPWQPRWIEIKMPQVANSRSSFESLAGVEASQAIAK